MDHVVPKPDQSDAYYTEHTESVYCGQRSSPGVWASRDRSKLQGLIGDMCPLGAYTYEATIATEKCKDKKTGEMVEVDKVTSVSHEAHDSPHIKAAYPGALFNLAHYPGATALPVGIVLALQRAIFDRSVS